MAYLDNVYAVVQIAPTGIPTYVRLSQNENGRVLNFAVSGDALPAGSTVALTGTKPDGAVYSASGTLADNVATFNEDEQLTAVAGEWDAKVEVTNSGNLIATGRIKFVIDADPSGGNIPSDSQLDGYIAEMLSLLDAGKAEAYGSPLVASTVAGMTDQSRVYVYTGSETGYTAGNWYYWNGSSWTSGGVYNAVAVSTDTTLSIAGKAADAKATGEAIDELKDDLNYSKNVHEGYILTATDEGNGTTWSPVGLPTDEQTAQAVNDWLDAHPEATTTVQDHSLTYGKLVVGTLGFVTPEMYGAKGDGETDDSQAFESAISTGKDVIGDCSKVYAINNVVEVDANITSKITNCNFTSASAIHLFDLQIDALELDNCVFDGDDTAYGVFSENTIFDSLVLKSCTVENMATVLDGTWPTTRALMVRANYADISDCIIRNNAGHGLIFHVESAGKYIVSNCVAEYNGEYNYDDNIVVSQGLGVACLSGDTINTADITITNCIAHHNGASGIAPHDINNVIISDCIAHTNGEHGFVIMQSNDSAITGCVAYDNAGSGIRVQGDFGETYENRFCNNILVSDNIIRQSNGIKVGAKATNVLVQNNVILNTLTPFVSETTSGRTANMGSSNVSFINNKVQHRNYYNLEYHDYFDGLIIRDNLYFDGSVYPNGLHRRTGDYSRIFVSFGKCLDNISPSNLLQTVSFSGLIAGTTYDTTTQKVTFANDISSGTSPMEFRIPIGKSMTIYCTCPDGFYPRIRTRGSGSPGTILENVRLYEYNSDLGYLHQFTITIENLDPATMLKACVTYETNKKIDAGSYDLSCIACDGYRLHDV